MMDTSKDSDTSFTLQSTMSPKIVVRGAITRKKALTFLSMKKNIRKSCAFQTNSKISIKPTPELISDSYTESSNSATTSNNENLSEKHDSVIVISDTDLSSVTSDEHNEAENNKECDYSKYNNVLKWLDNVNDSRNNSLHANNSKKGTYNESVVVIDPTIIMDTSEEVDDVINDSFKVIQKFVENMEESPRLRKSVEGYKPTTLDVTEVIMINDTFENLNLDESLTSRLIDKKKICSEKAIESISNFNKSADLECSTKVYVNDQVLFNEETDKSNPNPHNVDNKFSDQHNVVNAKFNNNYDINKSTNLNEDDIKLLNEIYGNDWNIGKSFTEKKVRTEKPQIPTEKKKVLKTSVKNNSRLPKSWSNLKTVWVQTIQNICDPDTSSANSENEHDDVRKRLSFTDSEDSHEEKKILTADSKKKVAKKNFGKGRTYRKKTPIYYGGSDEENSISDSSSDNEPKYIKTTIKKSTNVERKTKNLPNGKVIQAQKIDSITKVVSTKKSYSFLASLSGLVKIEECHSEAIKYRQNFSVFKEELTKKLFSMYNEKVFDNKLAKNMSVKWNPKMLKTAGFCYNSKITQNGAIIERRARIELATKVIDSADRLRDTLIHEMCHAASWALNHVKDGHGPIWNNWALKAMNTFPELPRIKRCHDYQINTKYTYKCLGCGYCIGRHSKSLDVERKRCGYCYGKFEVYLNKVDRTGTKKMVLSTPNRPPTAFSLFVKENYGHVKKPQLNHKDVMTILGEKFTALKVAKLD